MKTYLFDFDGTLVDSMPAFIAGVLKELDKNNCEYNNVHWFQIYVWI
jgi:beta-phosphoglucomutase-like phosphatase (HAD superfamily)